MGAPLFRIDAGPLPLTLMRLILLMMVARTIWLATRGQINWPRLSVLDFCWFAYLLVITFSLVTSDWAYNHRQPVSTWLFFYLLPTVVYLIARTTRLDLRHLHAAYLVLLIFGGYLGTLAILETQGPHALVFPRYIQSETYWEFLGRARGPFLNPVINGIMMTVCMVVALVWWPALKTTGKTLVAVYCLLMLVGVFFNLHTILLVSMWCRIGNHVVANDFLEDAVDRHDLGCTGGRHSGDGDVGAGQVV